MTTTKKILSTVSNNPDKFTNKLTIPSGESILFRPLLPTDVEMLSDFLESLSKETREFSTFDSYDIQMAKELCSAINKYDKLRFVLVNNEEKIIGLIEYSFDLPSGDISRYKKYGIELNKNLDCRWGLTLADDYQDLGLGSLLIPIIIEIAKQFKRKRIILFGGVLATNQRAIHYYEKHGFNKVGGFTNKDGKKSIDMILAI